MQILSDFRALINTVLLLELESKRIRYKRRKNYDKNKNI